MNDSLETTATEDGPIDRLDELLSLFFDDCLDETQVAELNELLLKDPAARTRSFDAAQLHADLHAFFRESEGIATAAEAPVEQAAG